MSVEDVLDYIDSDRFLSVKSAAAFLDVGEQFVRDRLKEISHVRIDGEIRIQKSNLLKWVESKRVHQPAVGARELADQVWKEMGL